MPTFGETVIEIIRTIISSIIDTAIRLAQLIGQLFGIAAANSGQLGSLHIMVIILILGAVLFGVFKLLKGDIKHLVMAFIILAILLLASFFVL